ncbi:MAG TPA: TetR/AcrR family transcriptional regulator [Calditrichaeota bacterium]|nr:TetR/AcrR family transcriptional regulator [Calditrichota bacterium]
MKETQERIVHSAMKLFVQKGFFETTVEDIARRARVAKGTIYLYFKDKPSIYITIIERYLQQTIQNLSEIEKQKISHRDKVIRIIERGMEMGRRFKNPYPIFSIENINLAQKLIQGIKPLFLKYHAEIIKRIAHIIQAGIKAGEFRKVNPDAVALYIISIVRTGLLIRQLNPDLKDSEKEIKTIFLKGLIRR